MALKSNHLRGQIDNLQRLARMIAGILVWCQENNGPLYQVMQCVLKLGINGWMKQFKSVEYDQRRLLSPQQVANAELMAYRIAIHHRVEQREKADMRRDFLHIEHKALDRELFLEQREERGIETPLGNIFDGHWRLFSTELFDLLDQPLDFRTGTLRFHRSNEFMSDDPDTAVWTGLELDLNGNWLTANDQENPYQASRFPSKASSRTTGMRMRWPEHGGLYPTFDSWFLFTLLGNGLLKIEAPIETVQEIYKEQLLERNHRQQDFDIVFYGLFQPDPEPWY